MGYSSNLSSCLTLHPPSSCLNTAVACGMLCVHVHFVAMCVYSVMCILSPYVRILSLYECTAHHTPGWAPNAYPQAGHPSHTPRLGTHCSLLSCLKSTAKTEEHSRD